MVFALPGLRVGMFFFMKDVKVKVRLYQFEVRDDDKVE